MAVCDGRPVDGDHGHDHRSGRGDEGFLRRFRLIDREPALLDRETEFPGYVEHGRARHAAQDAEIRRTGDEQPVAGDDHIRDKGVDVWVEPKATLFLLGTVMDFEETKMSSGFTFNNPNQEGACGCGESVQLKPADLEEIARARASASA